MSATIKSKRLRQQCPGCGRLLRIPAELEGQKVACKHCDHPIVVGPERGVAAEGGLTHVGTGSAFQIEQTWKSSPEREVRCTVIRHPLKRGLRGYTMGVECYGPGRVHLVGMLTEGRQPVSLGKVRPKEVRLVPLDDLYHAYLWVEKGATATARVIVARNL